MTLVPIVYTSLLVVGGIFILVLIVSYFSYKFKKPTTAAQAYINQTAYNRKPSYQVVSQSRQMASRKLDYEHEEMERAKIRHDSLRDHHENVNRDIPTQNYINPNSDTAPTPRIRDDYNETEYRRTVYRETVKKPRVTVLTTLHKTERESPRFGSGEYSSGFNLGFDPLRYYEDNF